MNPASDGLRALVEDVAREVARLQSAPDHQEASAALARSWAALVLRLDLDPDKHDDAAEEPVAATSPDGAALDGFK